MDPPSPSGRRSRGGVAVAERPSVEDLLATRPTVKALAVRLHQNLATLRAWEPDDLVQEVFLKALMRLERFEGRSSLKTWVVSVARNHLLSMARSAARRPRPGGDLTANVPARDAEPSRRLLLRGSTEDLLDFLRENPAQVEHGWEVLNLMLWMHADLARVAFSLTVHTGQPWTEERVRNVIRKVRKTPRGRALCSTLGFTNDGEE